MIRKDKLISNEDTLSILEKSQYINIAMIGENDYPYIITANYVFFDGKIYIHGAMKGSKVDFVKNNDRICANFIEFCDNLPEKFDTAYKSALVFGRAKIVDIVDRKLEILKVFINKYSKEYYKSGMEFIENRVKGTCIIEIEIENITGRQSNLDGEEKHYSI